MSVVCVGARLRAKGGETGQRRWVPTWDCAGNERCGYKGTPSQDAGGPACLPPTVHTPPAVGGGGGSINCIFYPEFGALHCYQ